MKYKCNRCDHEAVSVDWNVATGAQYEEFEPIEGANFQGEYAYVCPGCHQEVDDDQITPVAHIETSVMHYAEGKCPSCNGKLS